MLKHLILSTTLIFSTFHSIAQLEEIKTQMTEIEKKVDESQDSIKALKGSVNQIKAQLKHSLTNDSIKIAIQEILALNNSKVDTAGTIEIENDPITIHNSIRVSKPSFKNYLTHKYITQKNDIKSKKSLDSLKIINSGKNKNDIDLEIKKENLLYLSLIKKIDQKENEQGFAKYNFIYNYDMIDSFDIDFFNSNIHRVDQPFFSLTSPKNKLNKNNISIVLNRKFSIRKPLSAFIKKFVYLHQSVKDSIKNVTINVIQDRITKVIVYTYNHGSYSSSSASIPLFSINHPGRDDRLYNKGNSYILLSDVIKKYEPKKINYQIYQDVSKNNIKKGDSLILTTSRDINQYIDFSIYSDLPSLIGDQKNGLIEMKFSGSLITNRQNIFNTHSYIIRDIVPYLKIAKIDGQFSVITSDSTQQITNYTGRNDTSNLVRTRIMDIYQRAYIAGGIKINLFKAHFNENNSFNWYAGGDYRSAKFKKYDGSESEVGAYSVFSEFLLDLKPFEAFGGYLSSGWGYTDIKENDNILRQRYASIVSTRINLYFAPNNNRKLFFNAEYRSDINSRDEYVLFQVGYKAKINKSLFSNVSENK